MSEMRVLRANRPGTLRAQQVDGERRLAGYAAVFNSLSEDLGGFVERILPGAFAQSIGAGADVRMLWNHDSAMPLARTTNGSLSLWEDEVGLGFAASLAPVSYAEDAWRLIERGDLNQMSFSFRIPDGGAKRERVGQQLIQTLINVQLEEISPVTFPAYEATSVMARAIPARYREIDFGCPPGMMAQAQRGLVWSQEHGRGGSPGVVARARQIADGQPLSPEMWRRVDRFFNRHGVDREMEGWEEGEAGFPSAGRIAWALWGGDAGQRRAAKVVDAMEQADDLMDRAYAYSDESVANQGAGQATGQGTDEQTTAPRGRSLAGLRRVLQQREGIIL